MRHTDDFCTSLSLAMMDYAALERKVAAKMITASARRVAKQERTRFFHELYGMSPSSLADKLKTPEEKQPMKHEDFWIENTGVCPVPKGTLVDTKHKDGRISYRGRACLPTGGTGSPYAPMNWKFYGNSGEITHWRPSDLSAWIEGPLRGEQLPEGTRVECAGHLWGSTSFNTMDYGTVTYNHWRPVVPSYPQAAPAPPTAPPKRPLPAMFPPNAWVYRADGEAFPNGYWFAQVTGSHVHKGETIVQLDGTSSLPRHKLCMYKTGTTSPKADIAKAHAKALGVYWRHGEDRPHILHDIKQKQKAQDRIAELKQELADLEGSV